MLNFIKPRLLHPSLRLFLFVLFALVILVLAAEGGYYFLVQRKEKARLQATDWVNLIEGRINKIDGRTLIITVNDFNSLIPKKVEIEVASDAIVIIPIPEHGRLIPGKEFEEMQPILFTDLKVGDTIQAGILTKLARTKFKAESIALIK